jgi:phospholipase/lecithinase/hemolysin
MSSRFKQFIAAAFLFGSFVTSLHATSYSAIYSFGDSLSDAGNIYTLTAGAIPGAPYVNGEFSNGPVAVQDISKSLGLGTLTASLQGGNDFAYGDATSGATPIQAATQIDLTGPTGQIAQYEALHSTANPTALYTIWIGSNDLSNILTSGATGLAAATDAAAVIANIDSAINSLAGIGAKNFLILTVPDLGVTPDAIAQGPVAQAAASSLSASFDTALVNGATGIPSLSALGAADGVSISVLNTYSLLDAVVANPAAFGFTNVTTACVTGAVEYVGGTACASTLAAQNQYLFWDADHPTSAAQALVAEAALDTLSPEPTTCALMVTGLVGFYLKRRKRNNL